MNWNTIDAEQFLRLRGRLPIIDVRAPIEFQQGHVPTAHNVPLFNDDERSTVGTTYKKKGRKEAIRLGLKLIGPKMLELVDQVEAVIAAHCSQLPNSMPPNELADDEPQVIIYCARGGMRSDSVNWLLRQADLNPCRLAGGYKNYRKLCHEFFSRTWNLLTLTGMTGAGKTRILGHLRDRGEQVIDLEGLAHHRGSAFGGIGQSPQPTTEQFENLIFEELLACDPSRKIWVEDESRSVGSCVVPQPFFEQLHGAVAILVDVDVEERAQFLVSEYGKLPASEMIAAIGRISKRLGGQHEKAAVEALQSGDLLECARILLVYYDKTYNTCRDKNPRANVIPVDVSGFTDDQRIQAIWQMAEQISTGQVHSPPDSEPIKN